MPSPVMRTTARAGSVVVVIALVLLVLMGFAALVIDLGYARLVKGQLQSAADAAALAGAQRIDGSEEGLAQARLTAVEIAQTNRARGDALVLDANLSNDPEGELVLGIWDGHSFSPSTSAAAVNAVRVTLEEEGLAAIFSSTVWSEGPMSAAVVATALARPPQGAGGVEWYWPFATPDCFFETRSDDEIEDMTLVLSPDGADNTGWMAIGETIDAAWARSQLALAASCMTQWYTTGEVDERCDRADVGDLADTSNGTLEAGLADVASLIAKSPIPWDSAIYGAEPARDPNSGVPAGKYGRVLVGVFPILDVPDDYCTTGGKWAHAFEVTGFVWGVIYDTTTKGANKTVKIKLDLSHQYSVGDVLGGSDHGVVTLVPPSLVE